MKTNKKISNFLLKMLQKANKVMQHAYVPMCNFPVGVCIRSQKNKFFVGCNIENMSTPLSLCAEAATIASMVSAGELQIKEIVIVAKNKKICPPCGACRQRILEFSNPKTKIYLAHKNTIYATFTIAELLPLAFSLEAKN